MIDEDLRAAMHRDMACRAADDTIAVVRAQVPALESRLADEIWHLGTLPRGGFASGAARRAAREVVRGLEQQLDALHQQIELAEQTRRSLARQAEEARLQLHAPVTASRRPSVDEQPTDQFSRITAAQA